MSLYWCCIIHSHPCLTSLQLFRHATATSTTPPPLCFSTQLWGWEVFSPQSSMYKHPSCLSIHMLTPTSSSIFLLVLSFHWLSLCVPAFANPLTFTVWKTLVGQTTQLCSPSGFSSPCWVAVRDGNGGKTPFSLPSLQFLAYYFTSASKPCV